MCNTDNTEAECGFCQWEKPRYTLPDGRAAGYEVAATCDEQGCTVRVTRGLFHRCGDFPGSDNGCGNYYCPHHLYVSLPTGPQLCDRCKDEPIAQIGQDADRRPTERSVA